MFQRHADGKVLLKVAEKSPRSPWETSHCALGIKVWGIKRKGEHQTQQGVGAAVSRISHQEAFGICVYCSCGGASG